MKFTLSKSELQKLNTLVKTSQTVSDVSIKSSHYMFKLSDKLYASIYGNGNIVDFSVDATDIELSGNGYFNVDVNQLIQSFEKVYMSSGSDVATAEVLANKIIVSSGKSRISVNLFDILDEADFNEAFSALSTKKTELFNDSSTTKAVITPDVVLFMETVGKFINMIGSDRVSGLSLKNNKILYCDQAFSIIEKTLPDTLTPEDVKVEIPQNMFSLLSALSKLAHSFNIEYSSDDQYVYIDVPQISFKAILTVPEILCEYPDEPTLKQICPDENNMLEFDVDIPTLLTKMSMFDGVFPSSQWRWKTIEFYTSTEDGNTTMNMRYNNMCAEVDTDLPILSMNKVGNISDFSFRLASILIYDYLNKLVNGEKTAHIKVSPFEADQEHGVGVVFDVGNFKLVTSKMVNEESI